MLVGGTCELAKLHTTHDHCICVNYIILYYIILYYIILYYIILYYIILYYIILYYIILYYIPRLIYFMGHTAPLSFYWSPSN